MLLNKSPMIQEIVRISSSISPFRYLQSYSHTVSREYSLCKASYVSTHVKARADKLWLRLRINYVLRQVISWSICPHSSGPQFCWLRGGVRSSCCVAIIPCSGECGVVVFSFAVNTGELHTLSNHNKTCGSQASKIVVSFWLCCSRLVLPR